MILDLEHFRARVLQDALSQATADYWLNRAETLAAVGTPRCDAMAQACRNRALVAFAEWHHNGDVIEALRAGFRVTCRTCQTPTSPWTCSCGDTRIGDAA